MVEIARPAADRVRSNPLYQDPELFDMYMSALDGVLADNELSAALDEFGLSPATLRMRMVTSARRVLGTAARELAAYEDALARQLDADHAGRGQDHADGWIWEDFGWLVRLLAISSLIAGGIVTAAAVAVIVAGSWAEPVLWFAATALAVTGLAYIVLRLLNAGVGLGLIRREVLAGMSPDVLSARYRLMDAIRENELLSQARTLVNTVRRGRFGHMYSVVDSPGLSEVYDAVYSVPTDVAAEMDGLLTRLGGASIGVAGPRGSGKSTLIRGYCDKKPPEAEREEFQWAWLLGDIPSAPRGDLQCVVAAPVDYIARDFVLHMFAAFCRAVIDRNGRKAGDPPRKVLIAYWIGNVFSLLMSLLWRAVIYGGLAAILLHWRRSITARVAVPVSWVSVTAYTLLAIGALTFLWSAARSVARWHAEERRAENEALAKAARQHLARVRYLQTYTSGWSGGLRLPGGGEGQHSRGISRAEQPRSYPEIVDGFRTFAQEVAADVHGKGDRVFVGVDELDKIGSAEKAEHFLNEIKGVFGIPHLYFMVSVSDDALTAFERRGLPLRDAFDSSFDEIIRVGPLSYAESRRLLYRRVIGLTEPYVALCHCVAGGLARDLIRAARKVVRIATALTEGISPSLTAHADEHTKETAAVYVWPSEEPTPQPPTLAVVATAVIRDEIHRKLGTVAQMVSKANPGQARELQDTLYDVTRQLDPGEPALKIVDLVSRPHNTEPSALSGLRLDFATYAYYCATLEEVFTDRLDSKRMVEATNPSREPGTFDALAQARNAFTIDTLLAWRSITQFRKAWSLETRDPIK